MDTNDKVFQARSVGAPSVNISQVAARTQSVTTDSRAKTVSTLNEASLQQVTLAPPSDKEAVEMVKCYQNIEQMLGHRANPVVQLVTPTKSVANVDIAHAIAWAGAKLLGRRVLLIDATDTRSRPEESGKRAASKNDARVATSIHSMLARWPVIGQLQKMKQLADVVAGQALVEDVIVKEFSCRLYFAKIDAESLYSQATSTPFDIRAFLDGLRTHFDMVFITPSAVNDGPLATMLTSTVDGTVVVLESGQSRFHSSLRALEALQGGLTPILGVVLSQHRNYVPHWFRRFWSD